MSCRTEFPRMWLFTGIIAALSLTVAVGVAYAAWLTDSGTVNVQVADRTGAVVDATTAQGAFVSYFGDKNTTFGSSGTGTFEPFVRLQGTSTEQGYNTDGSTEFDTKVGTWTHAILVSQIPQRPCPQASPSLTCFELFVDINDNNSTSYISLNKVEVYFTDSATLTGYPFSGSATPEYKFAGNILIHDVNQGSGRGDLRYDIPINDPNHPITIPANCSYGNPACTTYFVLYSQWGTTTASAPDGNAYTSDGGFEEWKVKIYPAIAVTKACGTGTANLDVTPNTITYPINGTVTNTGTSSVSGLTLTDTFQSLPKNFDATPTCTCGPSGCTITTNNCSTVTLSPGGTVTYNATITTTQNGGSDQVTATMAGDAGSATATSNTATCSPLTFSTGITISKNCGNTDVPGGVALVSQNNQVVVKEGVSGTVQVTGSFDLTNVTVYDCVGASFTVASGTCPSTTLSSCQANGGTLRSSVTSPPSTTINAGGSSNWSDTYFPSIAPTCGPYNFSDQVLVTGSCSGAFCPCATVENVANKTCALCPGPTCP
jgi:hypothetical protein